MRRRVKGYHWYKTYITECPVCGRGSSSKEAQYGPPPAKDDPIRWEFRHEYDQCNEW